MTTLISNVTELINWLNAPSGTGQLTADITITATTWTVPTGILTSGIILDGNGYTIFLENISGTDYTAWPGLLNINGGTVQFIKFSGSPSNTNIIRPGTGKALIANNFNNAIQKVGTFNTVWFDFCQANKVDINGDNNGIIGSFNYNLTVTNCQIGRDLSNLMVKETGRAGMLMDNSCIYNVSNCVFFAQIGSSGNNLDDCGCVAGSFSSGTVSQCIFMVTMPYGLLSNCAIVVGGAINGNVSIQNCYQKLTFTGGFFYWNDRGSGILIPSYNGTNSGTYTIDNNYTIINNLGTFNQNPYLIANNVATKNLTNVAYTNGYSYTIGGTTTLTNCINTYTTSTPNSTEPINSFSGSIWDKTYTPPLLSFNSISPWNNINTAYDNPNTLSLVKSNPIISWSPSPATLFYPSPLTNKQLNAVAYQTDGITPLTGTFVYTPPAGTILNIGASQTLNCTFTPTSPFYNMGSSSTTVSVVQAPYTYINNQNDLYEFLYGSNTSYTKGIFTQNISILLSTWFVVNPFPNTFTAGRILDGNGYNIFLSNPADLFNYNRGIFNMQGGTFRNCTITGFGTIYPSANQGIIAGSSNSGIIEFVKITDGNFNLNSRDRRALFVGDNCNFTFNSCQVGRQSGFIDIGSNNSGAFAGQNFTGTFNNCIACVNATSSSQGINGGFVASSNGNITFNKCLVFGTFSDNVNGENGGFISKIKSASHVITFNNCYSGVNVSGSGPSDNNGGGFVGSVVVADTPIFFNNCYYVGTKGNSGALVNTGVRAILNMYDTATIGGVLSSASSSSNAILNNGVVQYFNNLTSQNGVSGGIIYDMAIIGSDIYIGGSFTAVNGDSGIQYLAKWTASTSTWGSVGGGVVNGTVYTMAVLGSNLYIGGSFTVPGNRIAIWNGTSFSQISGDTFNGAVRAIHVPNANSVFIGGDFTLMNGVTNMRYIARWTPSSWNELGVGGVNNSVYSIVSGGSDGPTNYSIIFGGAFTSSNNGTPGTLNRLGYWASTFPFFSAIGTGTGGGVNGTVNTLFRSGSTIYLGGNFTASTSGTTLNYWGTQNASNLANAITAIGSGYAGAPSVGMNGQVNKIIVNSGIIYAVGAFTTAGGLDQRYYVAYNASASGGINYYSSIAEYLNGNVQAIAISGNTVYIGGNFTSLVDNTSTVDIANLGGLAQISLNFNSTTYATSGQPSTTTPPVYNFNTYFTS